MSNQLVRVFFILFVLCNAAQLDAQKVKKKSLQFEYLHLPSVVLPDGLNTYSVSYSGKNFGEVHFEQFRTSLKMENYQRVVKDGDIHIANSFSFKMPGRYDVTVVTDTVWHKDNVSVKTERPKTEKAKTETNTAKSGSATKGKTPPQKLKRSVKAINWKVSGNLSLVHVCEVSYKDSMSVKKSAQSKTYTTSKTLEKSYDKKVIKKKSDAIEAWKSVAINQPYGMLPDFLKGNTKTQNGILRKSFGTYPAKAKVSFYYIKNPKGEHEIKFNSGVDVIEKVLTEMSATNPIDELALIADDAIQNWMEAKEYFSVYDKKQKKGHGACLHNIAAAYYVLDEFDMAIEYLEACEKLDFRKRPIPPKITVIRGVQEIVAKNRKTGRHFSIKRY